MAFAEKFPFNLFALFSMFVSSYSRQLEAFSFPIYDHLKDSDPSNAILQGEWPSGGGERG